MARGEGPYPPFLVVKKPCAEPIYFEPLTIRPDEIDVTRFGKLYRERRLPVGLIDNAKIFTEDAGDFKSRLASYETKQSHTDCRTEEGITVGLIDTLITVCRVLRHRDLSDKEVKEALKDLSSDEDFLWFCPNELPIEAS